MWVIVNNVNIFRKAVNFKLALHLKWFVTLMNKLMDIGNRLLWFNDCNWRGFFLTLVLF